jgi:hypothetical protein
LRREQGNQEDDGEQHDRCWVVYQVTSSAVGETYFDDLL